MTTLAIQEDYTMKHMYLLIRLQFSKCGVSVPGKAFKRSRSYNYFKKEAGGRRKEEEENV